MRTLLTRSALAIALAFSLAACDNFEDNLEFEAGDSRTVVGPSALTIASGASSVTGSYYVQAFTTTQNYTWSVSGPGSPSTSTRRDGEYLDVTFPSAGTYTITVNDGTYDGSRTVTVSQASDD